MTIGLLRQIDRCRSARALRREFPAERRGRRTRRLSRQSPRSFIRADEPSVGTYIDVPRQDPRGISSRDGPCWNVATDDRARRDDAIVADRHSRTNDAAASNKASPPDPDWPVEIGEAIVSQDQGLERDIGFAADFDRTLRAGDKPATQRNLDSAVEPDTEFQAEMTLSHSGREQPQLLELIERSWHTSHPLKQPLRDAPDGRY